MSKIKISTVERTGLAQVIELDPSTVAKIARAGHIASLLRDDWFDKDGNISQCITLSGRACVDLVCILLLVNELENAILRSCEDDSLTKDELKKAIIEDAPVIGIDSVLDRFWIEDKPTNLH